MSPELLNLLVPYVVPIIIAFAVSLAAATYQHILRWLPPNQRDMLEYAVSRAVHTVEQIIPGEEARGRDPRCGDLADVPREYASRGHRLVNRGGGTCVEYGREPSDRQGTYRSVPIYRGLTAGESKQAAPKYYRAK